jgi:predicted pyridoxine 5'-phosphate oxidase superfamily flavin-nucleotide-binding protein
VDLFNHSRSDTILFVNLTLLNPVRRMLSLDVLFFAQISVLCWLATVDAEGQPNVSPKEIFAVFDPEHLVIANIASPASVRNIAVNPRVCVSFVGVFVQKGYKVLGTARNIVKQDADFSNWAAPLVAMAGPRFAIHSVIVVRASAFEPILAPSYRLYPDETTEQSQVASAMRAYGVQHEAATVATPPAAKPRDAA